MAGQPGFFDADERLKALVGGGRSARASGEGGGFRGVPGGAGGGAGRARTGRRAAGRRTTRF